jgi:hemerythrin
MISWSESFSVKHKGIDEQHKKLIGIIEEVVSQISENHFSFVNLLELVNNLDNYTEEHLSFEEAFMKKYSYPETQEHIRQHDELRNKMEELNLFSIEKADKFYNDMLVYLVEWLSKHIMHTDKKLGLFLCQMNGKQLSN